MGERSEGASQGGRTGARTDDAARAGGAFAHARATKRALELVAVRGVEVVGVRHLLAGARAWIGTPSDAIAHISMDPFGGTPLVLGEATPTDFLIHVPPRARARTHGADGLGRLAMGPVTLSLREGDKTVVVLGAVRIRAQVVSIETLSRGGGVPATAIRWIAALGGLYLGVLALCAWLSPPSTPRLEHGSLQRAVDAVLSVPRGVP
jgi:hypothetical protein